MVPTRQPINSLRDGRSRDACANGTRVGSDARKKTCTLAANYYMHHNALGYNRAITVRSTIRHGTMHDVWEGPPIT